MDLNFVMVVEHDTPLFLEIFKTVDFVAKNVTVPKKVFFLILEVKNSKF